MKRVFSFVLTILLFLSMFPFGAFTADAEPLSFKIIGDLDSDGEITDWDGILLARYVSNWSVDITDEKIMDINGDGQVTEEDSIAFDRYLAGWPDETQIGKKPIYSVTYKNTKGAKNNNPTSYESGSATIELAPISAEHYTFDGWYIGDERVAQIPPEGEGDLVVTARWTPVTYTVTYNDTKGATNSNPTSFTVESGTIVLTDLEKAGYTFDGWFNGNQKVSSIPSGTSGNVTLVAKWTPISYAATFVADGDVVATRYFTVEDTTIANAPNIPSKAGYTGAWANYTLGTSNITIPAIYTLNEYTISYSNTKGAENSNPTSYTVITSTFRLADLQRDGYDFLGWFSGSKQVSSIEKGTTGNITLTAKWSAVDYDITYTDTKGATNSNPVEYNVESGTIYLTNIVAEHYTFDGWYWNGKKVTSVPAGSMGEIELVARWTPVNYTLTYKNTRGATNKNPVAYTVEDQIILQDISANGYTFDGWFIGSEQVTTIPVSSYGNKTLTAKWTPVTYSITYVDEKNIAHTNPTSYSIESSTITLAPLSAAGYRFDGWYNGNVKVTSIPTGSNGDLTLTAKWSIITYTITYKNTKDQTNNNPTSYTIEDAVSLASLMGSHNAHKFGYTFDGWYNGDELIAQIEVGTTGNLVLTAKWTPVVYNFVYYYFDDGTKYFDASQNPNTLTTTTVETWAGDYTLLNPAREGYKFVRWTIMDKHGTNYRPTILTIGGVKSYSRTDGTVYIKSEWTPVEYPIRYVSNIDVEITNPNPAVYTVEDSFTLADATSEYYTFKGWYTDAAYTKPVTTVEKGNIGELTLYAKWEFNGTYISTAEEFANIVYDMSGSYMLSNSIYISAPLGDETNPFTGYFCGNGHGIYDSDAFSVNQGTISQVYSSKLLCDNNAGTIKSCEARYGIARTNTGIIENCDSWGVVEKREKEGTFSSNTGVIGYNQVRHYVGGIAAYNTGVIRQCRAGTYELNAQIGTQSDYISNLWGYVGGIAGYSTGEIEDCYFTATNIIAACKNFSNFANSPSFNWNGNETASAHLYAGGLVGYSKGTISGSYANITAITGQTNGCGWSANNKHYGSAYGYVAGLAGYAVTVSNSFCNVANISYDKSNESSLCSYYRNIGTSLADYYSTKDYGTLYYNSDCSLSTSGIYSTKKIGTATSSANYKSRNFMVNTIGWSEDIWYFENGSLPKLAWEVN